jgi:ketosteroid isomerase-like protein
MRTKLTLALAVTACLLAPCARAQNARELAELRERAKQQDVQQEELINLEHETVRAMQWNTGTFFRRVYGDDFVGVMPSGQIKDKTNWIASIENSGITYSSFVVSDVHVRLFAETAVVTALWSSRGTLGGKSFNRQSRVTHVYVYGMRGWKVVASQETLLPG